MNQPAPIPGLILAALIAAGAVALLSWWFVFAYARIRWNRTPEGRHLMRLTVYLALTFTCTVVFNVMPVPPIVGPLTSLVLFGALAAEIYTRITLLHDAQREADDERTEV